MALILTSVAAFLSAQSITGNLIAQMSGSKTCTERVRNCARSDLLDDWCSPPALVPCCVQARSEGCLRGAATKLNPLGFPPFPHGIDAVATQLIAAWHRERFPCI